MKGKFGKIGLLSVAVLMALVAVGVGLAHWQAALPIDGTVTTGKWKEVGGTPGFWKNWDEHNTYTETEIFGFLSAVNGQSLWFNGRINSIEEMQAIFAPSEGGTMEAADEGRTMEAKFLRQYLATRLNVVAERLFMHTFHLFSSYDPENYLGLGGQGTLQEIIGAIENKCHSPTEGQFEIMKNICDALNNLAISPIP